MGTKLDLRDDAETLEELNKMRQIPITREDGEQLAREIGAIRYVECSASTQVMFQKFEHLSR